jgi:hypothetical protein
MIQSDTVFQVPALDWMPAQTIKRWYSFNQPSGIGHRATPIIAIQIQNRIIPIRGSRTAIHAIIPIAPRDQAETRTHPRQENKFPRILIFLNLAY